MNKSSRYRHLTLPNNKCYRIVFGAIFDLLEYELPANLMTGDEFPFEIECLIEEVSINMEVDIMHFMWQDMICIRPDLGWYMPSIYYELTVDSHLAYWGKPDIKNDRKFDLHLWNRLLLTCESFLREYNQPKNLGSTPDARSERSVLWEWMLKADYDPPRSVESVTRSVLTVCALCSESSVSALKLYNGTVAVIQSMANVFSDPFSEKSINLSRDLPRDTLVVYFMLIFECVQFVEGLYYPRLRLTSKAVIPEDSPLRRAVAIAESHAMDRLHYAQHLY